MDGYCSGLTGVGVRANGARGANPGRRDAQGGAHDWCRHLPREWLAQIVRPTVFMRYREYEMPAERVVGLASDDEPCFCEHFFVLNTLQSDDDEEFFVATSYREHLVSWRLRNGRWLIYRMIGGCEAGQTQRAFFTFADEMPR